MKIFRLLLLAALLQFSALAGAALPVDEQQSHARIREVAAEFVKKQTASLPGQVTIRVGDVDQRVIRHSCLNLEAFLPPGSRLLGNGMVGVRCPGKGGWTLFLHVHVAVKVKMLIANRPLPRGQVLGVEDIALQEGELAQMGVLTDPAQAIGKVLKFGIGAGQVLKRDMLRPPYIVKRGQLVHLQVEGSGFSIQAEGHALNDASEGQDVKVKTTSGKVINGKALSDGAVAIRP